MPFKEFIGVKILLIITIFSSFAVAGHSQTNTNAGPVAWKFQAPLDGRYGPESTRWFAWENIEIEGTRFHYFVTSDCPGPGNPDYKGKMIQFRDHMCLDHPKMPNPDRVCGLLTNRPVIWTYEAFDHWKKTGEIDPMGILYRSEPRIARDPATNRAEMFRQVRVAVRGDRKH